MYNQAASKNIMAAEKKDNEYESEDMKGRREDK